MCTIKGIERTVLWVLEIFKKIVYMPYTLNHIPFFLYILPRNKA